MSSKVGTAMSAAKANMKTEGASEERILGDCARYTFFTICFTIMCMCGRTLDAHNFWISNQFITTIEGNPFNDIIEQGRVLSQCNIVEDVYLYLDQVLMPLLFVNSTYDGEDLSSTEKNFAHGQNKLLGGARITVIRVKEETCKFTGLPSEFGPCYPKYSKDKTNKSNYWVDDYELEYYTASEAKSVSFSANYEEYGGDGNVYDLDPDPTKAYEELEALWYGGLIKRDTRVMFFDFVTLNANLNLHTVGRVCFEIPADGGVITYSDVKTWRFWRYLGTRGKVLITMEILITLMVVLYTWEELKELYTEGWVNYKGSAWNMVDWANLIFFYLTIIWRIRVETSESPDMVNIDAYESYRAYVWDFSMEAYFNMVNGGLLYFKLFKYLNTSKKMRLLFALFYKTSSDMFFFVVILCVFYMAYGLGGYLIFSSDVSDYRQLHIAVLNLFRYTVTDMDYDSLKQSSVVVGAIFYVSWTLTMLLILVNVFVAILSEGYEDVQDENRESEEGEFQIKRMFSLVKSMIFHSFDLDNDGHIDEHELAKAHGLESEEAKEIIDKFDTSNKGALDKKEFSMYMKDRKRKSVLD